MAASQSSLLATCFAYVFDASTGADGSWPPPKSLRFDAPGRFDSGTLFLDQQSLDGDDAITTFIDWERPDKYDQVGVVRISRRCNLVDQVTFLASGVTILRSDDDRACVRMHLEYSSSSSNYSGFDHENVLTATFCSFPQQLLWPYEPPRVTPRPSLAASSTASSARDDGAVRIWPRGPPRLTSRSSLAASSTATANSAARDDAEDLPPPAAAVEGDDEDAGRSETLADTAVCAGRENLACKVCFEHEMRAIFLPCRHMATCGACANTLLKTTKCCPICRGHIDGLLCASIQ